MSYSFNYRILNHGNMSVSVLFALRFYYSILVLLRLKFNVVIGLDEASCPRPWSYPYFLVSLYMIVVGIWARSHIISPILTVSLAYRRLHAANSS